MIAKACYFSERKPLAIYFKQLFMDILAIVMKRIGQNMSMVHPGNILTSRMKDSETYLKNLLGVTLSNVRQMKRECHSSPFNALNTHTSRKR